MSNVSIRFFYEPQRELGFASIGAAYMSIGTPVDNPVILYKLFNLTNATVQFSIDGIEDEWVLPANGYEVIDVATNKATTDGRTIGRGTSFYAKEFGGVAPTSGSVILSVAYAA